MARFKTHCLRKGTLLYHGTRAREPFEEGGFAPNAPAWFSTSETVAREFVDWHEGPKARILVYRLTSNVPCLVTIEDKDDFQRLEDRIEEETGLGIGMGASDMAEAICERTHYNGWYIPYNYPSGDDILLCNTDALEFVESRSI